ncbi:hypothetical protein JOD02_001851 [Caldicoprobacter guelmensis]|nr:hypothetical protein [Caldicoprobacter guelmensis]
MMAIYSFASVIKSKTGHCGTIITATLPDRLHAK